jgi:hypothetical protein
MKFIKRLASLPLFVAALPFLLVGMLGLVLFIASYELWDGQDKQPSGDVMDSFLKSINRKD